MKKHGKSYAIKKKRVVAYIDNAMSRWLEKKSVEMASNESAMIRLILKEAMTKDIKS